MTVRIALLLVALLASPAAAHAADPTFKVDVSKQQVAPGDEVLYTVTIETGAEAERFTLAFNTRSAGVVAGHPTATLVAPSMRGSYDGPGNGAFMYVVPSPLPPCSQLGFADRTTHAETVRALLDLPANSTSRVRLPMHVSRLIPRPGEQYVVTIDAVNDDRPDGTLSTPGPLSAPPLSAADGPRGVWLAAATEPASLPLRHGNDPPCTSDLPVVRDRGITVTGQADPALPGQQVVVEAGARGGPGPEVVGTATVGDDGTFAFGPWRPPAPGDYELRVAYRSQQPEYADDATDHAVGFRYEVSPPPAPETTDGDPTAIFGRRARVRRGIARVRIGCPIPAARSCTGTLRLTHRRRKVGTRAFSVSPGRAVTLRVRLNRRGRALSRRHPRLTVRVTLR